jgi:hypothetical protein
MQWVRLRGYSIDEHLKQQGLSFEAFDVVDEVLKDDATKKLKKKMANRLVKELRSEGLSWDAPFDLNKVKHGVYCIALDGEFEFDYDKKPSRVLYVGSGNIKSRIQSHLEGKLFDFAYELRVIPFQFYFCDLTETENGETVQRALEQQLLEEFFESIDEGLPLLNSINASRRHKLQNPPKGWNLPLQRDRGRQATEWLIRAKENNEWKGALQNG